MGAMDLKKQAVGVRTGGFMQTRKGVRPLHVETLLRKKSPESAANAFEPIPAEPAKSFEQSIAATAGEEFQPEQEKEAAFRERVEIYGLHDGKLLAGRLPDESVGVYGGGVDPGETPEQAAAREFLEESGYGLKGLKRVEVPPFESPWVERPGAGTASPEAIKKWEERAKAYPEGHRTTYLTGVTSGRMKPPSEKAGLLKNVQPMDLAEAIAIQESMVPRMKSEIDTERLKSRLAVLQALRKQGSLRRDTVAEKPTTVSPELVESVKQKYLGEMHGHKVFQVDGGRIRDKIDTDFALGGNSARYSYVPQGELWVENTGDKGDMAHTAKHEAREERRMQKGETYNQAHSEATKVEKQERVKTASKSSSGPAIEVREGVIRRNPIKMAILRRAGRAKDAENYIKALQAAGRALGTKDQSWASKSSEEAWVQQNRPDVWERRLTKPELRQIYKRASIADVLGKLTPLADDAAVIALRSYRGQGLPEGPETKKQKKTKVKTAAEAPTGRGEFAPGIPIGRVVKRLPSVKEKGPNVEWTASLALHPAAVRGDHFDLRLVDQKGQAHSWAVQEMPEPGRSTYAAQQPTHSGAYAKRTEPFSIPLGVYGGTRPGAQVEPKYVQPVEVISASNDRVHLLRHQGQETEELVLRRVAMAGDRTPIWALHNATRTRTTREGQRLPDTKPRYQEIPIGSVDPGNTGQLMTAKLDGAHTLVDFPKVDRMARTYSYRPTQRQSGLIEHTFKFPDFQNLKTTPALRGTLIRAETWATDSAGKAIPASELGGILNSNVNKARQLQQEQGITLRRTGIDVVRYKGKDVSSAPFEQKLEILKEVNKATKGAIELPIAARTPEEKTALLSAVKAGKLPETREGVVLHDLGGSTMMKAKVRPDTDVYVREIFTKPRTEAKGQAAGFKYSFEPTGPIVGHVGTGFSQQMRKDMLKNPDQFVGRVAKVQSAGQYVARGGRTGALVGSPAFKEWHIDKTPPELLEKKAVDPVLVGAYKMVEDEADPERIVGHLAETRSGRALRPILESSPMRSFSGRVRAAYHRLMKGKDRA